ncbi:hypothetical protein TWF506_007724 [Arthrobotrys conoides]|uniref:CCHC-type domain-containing protein n=1 Tax=Arthrobotrys conoides TaxID=74498 RepID=A0AAN8NYV7_9PEZI
MVVGRIDVVLLRRGFGVDAYMDSPNRQEHIVSMMEGMKLDLDSKAVDIAEIKDSLALLKSFILKAAADQANNQSEQDIGVKVDAPPPRPLSAKTKASKDGGNSDTLSTSLTKVSHSTELRPTTPSETSKKGVRSSQGSPKPNNHGDGGSNIEEAASKSPLFDSNHLLRGLSTSLTGDDELARPESTGGVSLDSSHWQMKPQTEVASDHAPTSTVQQPQEQTTKVSINGVTRAIPSSIKGHNSSKKPSMPMPPGGFGPPHMRHNNGFGAPARHNMHGFQGGPQPQPHPHFNGAPPNWQAQPGAQWQGGRQPGIFNPAAGPQAYGPPAHRYNSYAAGMHAPSKFRPKTCTNCGDPAHFYKHCPQRSAGFKGGQLKKRFNGKKCLSFFGYCRDTEDCNCPEKAFPFSIDRQTEFIDYMIEINRIDGMKAAAQTDIQFGPHGA